MNFSISAQDNPAWPANVTKDEMQRMQDMDDLLIVAWTREEDPSQPFFGEIGQLYRKWESCAAQDLGGTRSDGVSQLVLPRQCRHQVLQLAHTIPMAGHLGKKKTTARIA